MTLVEYLTTLRRYWILIVALGAVAGGGAFAYAQTLPKVYGSQASVMVIPARGDTTGELVQGSNYVQNLVQTYTILASSPVVLGQVIADLGLDEEPYQLAHRVSVDAPLNTVVININVTDGSPLGAQQVANATAHALSTAVAELSPKGEDGKPAVRIELIAPGRLATTPLAPNTRLMGAVGAVAGLALGIVIALAIRLFSTRVASTSDLSLVSGLPVLGEIPVFAGRDSLPVQIRAAPAGRLAEAVRNLVVALKFVNLENAKRSILVTSATEGEGKTSIALGLAIMLAEAGHRVLLIDGDLRRPMVGNLTQLESSIGLSTVLVGDRSLGEAMQQWGHDNLHVLTSGEIPPNPVQLLSGNRIGAVLEEAQEQHDLVLIDGAPILPVSDSRWLATRVDGTIVVARLRKTHRKSIERMLASLEASHSPVLGVIANGVKDGSKSSYYVPHSEPAGYGRPEVWRVRRERPAQ